MNNKTFQQFFDHIRSQATHPPSGFRPAGALTESEAFHVYRQGYTARLTEALGEIYESVWKYLGDEIFFEVAEDFIFTHPSTDGNLGHYGFDFPHHLQSLPAVTDHPFLPDLARVDLFRHRLFHTRTEAGMTAESLVTALEAETPVQLVSSVGFLESPHPLFEIWSALQKDEPPPTQAQRQTLVFWKNQDQVQFRSLNGSWRAVFHGLSEGQALSQCLSAAPEGQIQELFAFLSAQRLLKVRA